MIVVNRTKIVCTMGPSTEDEKVLADMIRAGMDVARLNFSHGDHAYHRAHIERIRRVSKELGTQIAILADTRGPEIRTGLNVGHEPIMLHTGAKVTLTTKDVDSTQEAIAITYDGLPAAVKEGTRIFMDDGLIEVEVESTTSTDIHCVIINGGYLGERKGVNVPNVVTAMPSVTDKDREDIMFACEMGIDAIAASFVCDADAVRQVRSILHECNADDTLVISKVESALALQNFDGILEESDGIMVARGDLGVEIPPALVPYTQKQIIQKCNVAYKPVITATQMLDSMVHNPRPTRAEVTDVANAIFDGTDCVMLSGETAAGHFPVESVRMMAEVCARAEDHLPEGETYHMQEGLSNVSSATSFSAVQTAQRVNAVAILCPTSTGRTARIMSIFRPKQPIIATSPDERTVVRSNFYWGVQGLLVPEESGLMKTCYGALSGAQQAGYIKSDDIVIITAGDPVLSPLTGSAYETATNVCMVAQVV